MGLYVNFAPRNPTSNNRILTPWILVDENGALFGVVDCRLPLRAAVSVGHTIRPHDKATRLGHTVRPHVKATRPHATATQPHVRFIISFSREAQWLCQVPSHQMYIAKQSTAGQVTSSNVERWKFEVIAVF